MDDTHNKPEDNEYIDVQGVDVTHEDRQAAMQADYDARVWGEIVDGGGDDPEPQVINPIPLKKKMSVGERTRRATSLKLAGASYASIAQTLGYNDASAARKAVMRGMDSALQENAAELRKLHYGRLEHMLMLLWPDVNQRDLASMGTALGVMDRMERLYGLAAPDKLDVTAGTRETVIVADGDKESYLKALEEAGARLAPGALGAATDDDDEDDD